MPIKVKDSQHRLLGTVNSYVEVAQFLEKRGKKGTFWLVPTNFKRLSAIKKCTFDGVFVHVENYGYV